MDVPERALEWLLGRARTGDDDHDALHAARVSRHLRELNSLHGGDVMAWLRSRGWTLRDLARELHTSKDSIARWSDPPPTALPEPESEGDNPDG